ncbi:MAG: hypothetical protein IPK27_21535 [Rhodanobacteraceae bacterium]|nr:hypothetical protein [Rhodanobacteraceae bacterium]
MNPARWALDQDGQPMRDSFGNYLVSVNEDNFGSVATSVFGGVSKMFCLYEDDEHECIVAATTAGQAVLNGVTIEVLAKKFQRKNKRNHVKFANVADVAEDFLNFMRIEWEKDCGFETVPLDQQAYLHTVQFLLGGYDLETEHPRIFRIDIKENSFFEQFPDGDHTGVCWLGAANYAERVIRGFDQTVKLGISREVKLALDAQRTSLIESVSRELGQAGVVLPEGLELNVSESFDPTFDWQKANAPISYGNLPLQHAVEFVSLLVNIQSGMMRFCRGIPTVGGRTHIGLVRRGQSFEMLNEAAIQHSHVGYANEV